MIKQVNFQWPILTGSVSTAMSQCGKKRCACKRRKPKLHGIYYRWTGIINGRRTTKTITKEAAKECSRRIKNYRKLLKQIDDLAQQGLQQAPWDFKNKG